MNNSGQLGLSHTEKVTAPTPIPGSETVTRWVADNERTFAWSGSGLQACGLSDHHQLGVLRDDDDEIAPTFIPVALPGDVSQRVGRVVIIAQNGKSTFFLADRHCFGCGWNHRGLFGIGVEVERITTPCELTLPVDDVLSNGTITVFRSGDNELKQILLDVALYYRTPVPLVLPGPVVKVAVGGKRGRFRRPVRVCLFVQLTDESWVGRGVYAGGFFVHGAVPGWTAVDKKVAIGFPSGGPGPNLTILPTPIDNHMPEKERLAADASVG